MAKNKSRFCTTFCNHTRLLIWSFNFNCFYCICVTFSAESLKQKNGSVRTSRSLSKFELGHYLLRRAPVLSINFEKNAAFLQIIIAFFKNHQFIPGWLILISMHRRKIGEKVISFFSLNFSHGGKRFNWKGCNYWHLIESLGSIKCQKM